MMWTILLVLCFVAAVLIGLVANVKTNTLLIRVQRLEKRIGAVELGYSYENAKKDAQALDLVPTLFGDPAQTNRRNVGDYGIANGDEARWDGTQWLTREEWGQAYGENCPGDFYDAAILPSELLDALNNRARAVNSSGVPIRRKGDKQ